ncbi:MAG: acyl-CoA dehydrogenase family protein [Ilumatobacteraceae bacterium]|nr:acyl-CoA dehydrogenase family protein [Acidimicrobiales bacterium]MCB9393452.1 acyl-CoA dehydrogenase family protein [Acidimicrobiaceae bacterium]
MFEWSDEHRMIREAVQRFVDEEVRPHVDELEHGDLPPYDILRKMFATFGMDAMARDRFAKQIAREQAALDATARCEEPPARTESGDDGGGLSLIPIIELCRVCPGMVTAMGVSMGLTSAAIMSKGTIRQKQRWALDLLTMDKVGAWAITEPGSGSDAFGSMRSTARRDGDEYVLNGSKTFITNGPYADTIVFICKLDEGNPPEQRKVLSFVLDRGMPGLVQSKPLRKMGMHSSPTGELFLDDVRVGLDRLIGETEDLPSGGRDGAKATFQQERAGVAAMALGIIEECLQLSVQYARDRVQFGRPIGEFQLIQEKLARMEVARMNVQNLVFRTMEMGAAGRSMTLAEASAMKLYSARAATEVAMEAVQLYGGNGYMSEFRVEQLARDAKVLQIYAGTDEIQITHIAKDLLRT